MNTPSPVMKMIPNAQQPPVKPAGGARARRSGQSLVRSPSEARERAVPPMTKTLSAAFSARSDGFDDSDGSPECRVYTQMRRIEQVCIRRGLQWRGGAARVALVAPQQVGQ